MPVWLKVSLPGRTAIPCLEVEVRRNGKPLPRIIPPPSPLGGGIVTRAPCGYWRWPAEVRHVARMPLHLQYRFDQPGTYEVRNTVRDQFRIEPPLLQSTWMPIEILPGTQADRFQWLKNLNAPTKTVELLTDYLPAILGIPDQPSLDLLRPYLYHADNRVRQYSMHGLIYWPEPDAEAAVLDMVRTRGPGDVAMQFLIRRPELIAANGNSLVQSAIPYLRFDSPVLLRGAVTAVHHAALREGSRVTPAIRAQAEGAMLEAADHVIKVADDQTIIDYAGALAGINDPRASTVLWGLTDHKIARGQAVGALAWRRSPADLPRLAQLARSCQGTTSGFRAVLLTLCLTSLVRRGRDPLS